jgi:hypothetical protein
MLLFKRREFFHLFGLFVQRLGQIRRELRGLDVLLGADILDIRIGHDSGVSDGFPEGRGV